MNRPNIMIKAYNYLKALSKHVLNGMEKVDVIEYYDRIHACTRCEFMIENKNDNYKFECGVCGCPIEEKASWKTEQCPKDKWN